MKTGIELIADERQKQIDKHGFTGEHHANHPEWYEENQLTEAATELLKIYPKSENLPLNWDADWWADLCNRHLLTRFQIAGALIAAEIDRLQQNK